MGTILRRGRIGRFGQGARGGLAEHFVTLAARATRAFAGWWVRAQQRRCLARLDDRLLRDIGLTRLDVQNETDKPFWQG